MTDPTLTDHLITQGLTRAIEALGIIEPTCPFEGALTRQLLVIYRQHLGAMLDAKGGRSA